MSADNYRRRRWTYSFRAWIDNTGSNVDREHTRCSACRIAHSPASRRNTGVRNCQHFRLWDLNTRRGSRNLLRIVRRRQPPHLHVIVGPRYWTVFRIGRSC